MTSMLEFMNTVQNNKVATYSPVNTCNNLPKYQHQSKILLKKKTKRKLQRKPQ